MSAKTTMAAWLILCAAAWPLEAQQKMGTPELVEVKRQVNPKGTTAIAFAHKAVGGMDSPGYVAKGLQHHVIVGLPKDYDPNKTYPLMLWLHGFGDKWQGCMKVTDWFTDYLVVAPNDPLGTWFYGYSDQLPDGDPNRGTVVNYTERRILWYLDHMKKDYPVDRRRVFVLGGSMGGTGATSLALRYPQRFAGADARKGATNRRYCHWKSQCERIWGKVETGVRNNEGVNVWDWQNMAWYASKHHKDATWIRTLNGREDTSIPYRQLAGPPGVRPMSFYVALERYRIGHQCFWDTSSHSKRSEKPVALDDWWNPFTDTTSCLRLDLSFPAFSNFSANDHPGTGKGDAVGGDRQLGDNTYDGDPNGGLNRFLRWNGNTIVDEQKRWSIEIRMSPGRNGYKGKGTETVDVTPRRLQKFAVKPGVTFKWSTGAGQSGEAKADGEGVLTLPGVRVTTEWTRLTVVPSR